MKLIICCAIVPVLIFSTVRALDISVKGDGCGSFDRCSARDLFRTCSCASDCHEYTTCCIDAENFPLMSGSSGEYLCNNDRTTTPVYAKRSCSEDFEGDSDIRSSCLESEYDKANVLSGLLVSSWATRTTYWNKDCAICNNVKEDDLIFWTVQVLCPSRRGEMNFNQTYIKKHLVFDREEAEWGIKIEDDFVQCFISFSQPGNMVGKLHYCAPNMTSTCPEDYPDKHVADKCSYYHGERKKKGVDLYFKNVHCALCNNITVKELECVGLNYGPVGLISDDDFVKVVFKSGQWLNRDDEDRENYKCSKGFAYHPFQNRCRKLYETVDEPVVINSSQNIAAQISIFVLLLTLYVNKLF